MSGPHHLDEQQAQLVEHLRAAGGAPVSFDELRAIGIENPALLCYELAAVGLPVTRGCSPGGSRGRRPTATPVLRWWLCRVIPRQQRRVRAGSC